MADLKISDLTAQTTLHDADLGVGVDTTDTTQAASGTTKKFTWTTIKAFLKTYFDGLYLGISANAVSATTATTATKFAATKTINGTAFDGSTNITLANNSVTAAQLATNAITLGYTAVAPFNSASATDVQINNASLTITIPAGGRYVKITGYFPTSYTTAAGYTIITIWDGTVGSGSKLQESFWQGTTGAQQNSFTILTIVSPAAGTKTYNLGLRQAGGTTANLGSGFLIVETI